MRRLVVFWIGIALLPLVLAVTLLGLQQYSCRGLEIASHIGGGRPPASACTGYSGFRKISTRSSARIDQPLSKKTARLLAYAAVILSNLLYASFSPVTVEAPDSLDTRLLGGCLSGGLLCLNWLLKTSGIMETIIFMPLNGLAATGITVLVFRQRLSRYTKRACVCSSLGSR